MILTGLLVAGSVAYCLPTIVALATGHPRIISIATLNVLAGWTLVGWIVAMVWAVTK
jgi:hypothetical protein